MSWVAIGLGGLDSHFIGQCRKEQWRELDSLGKGS